jgi:hypothetical protein
MTQPFFAIAVTAVMFGTVPMTSQAAPIAPLVGTVVDHSDSSVPYAQGLQPHH